MKTNRKNKICSIVMLLCLLTVSLQTSLQTVYAKKAAEKTTYVAFGDSIAAGYGLNGYSDDQTAAPGDSYQALVADFLHTQSCNYAVSGDTSDNCIKLLQTGKADADLQNADIVTLSIGSNDLLLPFIRILLDYIKANPDLADPSYLDPAAIEDYLKNGFTLPQIDISRLPEYYKQAAGLLQQLTDNDTLHAGASAFPEKLQTILSLLQEKAPQAEIYVTNIYNPFAFLPKIGELADQYIQEINQAFTANAPDYTLIDVYTPFHEKELTNVRIDYNESLRFQLDPHPSAEGHAVIGELVTTALKDTHAPKAATLRSLSVTGKKKVTIKAKLPADADGYQVLYAASKNGSYQSLGKTDKKTYTISSKKIKSGKTYYIRLRSYRTIKGVTYYGKDSAIKKITIRS